DFFEPVVRADFEKRWKLEGHQDNKHKAAFREKVTREHFEATPADVQKSYKHMAKREAKDAVKAWKDALYAPPSEAAVDRQAALDRLGSFAGPLLAGMHEILGMHVTLLVGGPEPRKGGQINVLRQVILFSYQCTPIDIDLSMHEGVDQSPVPLNWQTYDKKKFKAVVGLFQEYLGGCYSTEERDKRKLPEDLDAPYTFAFEDMEKMSDDELPPAEPQTQPKRKRATGKGKKTRTKKRDNNSSPSASSSDSDSSDPESSDSESPDEEPPRSAPLPYSAQKVDYVHVGMNRMVAVPRLAEKRKKKASCSKKTDAITLTKENRNDNAPPQRPRPRPRPRTRPLGPDEGMDVGDSPPSQDRQPAQPDSQPERVPTPDLEPSQPDSQVEHLLYPQPAQPDAQPQRVPTPPSTPLPAPGMPAELLEKSDGNRNEDEPEAMEDGYNNADGPKSLEKSDGNRNEDEPEAMEDGYNNADGPKSLENSDGNCNEDEPEAVEDEYSSADGPKSPEKSDGNRKE
ncbi:hypothetical protein BJ138DRAFT_1108251, partial [Hygrophoropsis aurantiaca]